MRMECGIYSMMYSYCNQHLLSFWRSSPFTCPLEIARDAIIPKHITLGSRNAISQIRSSSSCKWGPQLDPAYNL